MKNESEKGNAKLISQDYGILAERIGKRKLFDLTMRGGGLEKFFPNVDIVSVKVLSEGDFALEVSYKDKLKYGKKIIIFEIKHGKVQIQQKQLRRYCSMILNPGKFFRKAGEAKVFFMLFDYIDTMRNFSSYSIRELDKDLAQKIFDAQPISERENIKTFAKWKVEFDKKDTANLISALYGYVE